MEQVNASTDRKRCGLAYDPVKLVLGLLCGKVEGMPLAAGAAPAREHKYKS
jgi:hypothetical protein